MALPHPHGNASGEIAHNSSYDTGVTPGSTGGKFIGFGEQGTSEIANRPHWALSENIDYIYDVISADRAIPAGDAFTVSGGSGLTHQITDDVWCGDVSYPADAQEGLQLLFNVLDDQYNELLDPSGNEVVVGIVRDATNTTDEYKSGFVTNPTLNFYTIDSSGTPIGAYQIPDTTDVRVMYGSKGSLENLPIDAFTKFKVQSADEAPAGVFWANGSVPMTGDADWNGNRLLNLLEARGSAGADMLLRSQQDLNFQDQYAGPIPFSESGQTAFLGTLNASMLANINSEIQQTRSLSANRTLVKGGVLSYDAVAGTITLPAGMVVSANGESANVGGSVLGPVTASANKFGVIDSTGTFVEKDSPLATDVPVVYYNWNGVDTFTEADDIRWLMNGVAGAIPITVSDNHPYADFDNLNDPIKMINRLHSYSTQTAPVSYEIIVLDSVTVTESITPSVSVKIRGARLQSQNKWPRIIWEGPDADDVFDFASGISIHVENLTIWVMGATNPTGSAVFKNPAEGSTFRNLYIERNGSNNWDYIFVWDASRVCKEVTIDRVRCEDFDISAVDTTAANSTSRDLLISNCYFEGGATIPINVPTERNRIENCDIGNGTTTNIMLGPNSWVVGCTITHTSLSTPSIELYEATDATYFMNDDYSYNILGNLIQGSTQRGIYCAWTGSSSRTAHVNIQNNTFRNCQRAVRIENTASGLGDCSYTIANNQFYEMSSNDDGIYLDTAKNVVISGNAWTNCDGTLIHVIQHTRVAITGNVFESYRWSTGDSHAIQIDDSDSDDEEILIQGNIFTGNGAGADPTPIYINGNNVTVDGNHFGTDVATIVKGVLMETGKRCKVTNNTFRGIREEAIRIAMYDSADPEDGWVLVSGNLFTLSNHGYVPGTVLVMGTPGCRIINNVFVGDRSDFNQQSGAVYANDLLRSFEGLVVSNNTFRDVIGKKSTGSEWRVVWVEGDTYTDHGAKITDNYFDQCGCDDAAAVYSRIIEVEGDGYQICRNVFKDTYGPQSTSGDTQLMYVTGAVFDECYVNDNVILEDATTSAGRITLGDWTAIKSSSVAVQFCRNVFHTLNYDTSITANGTSEIFIDLVGGYIHDNTMTTRVRNTISGTKAFINATSGSGSHFVGNKCNAALYHMTINGDRNIIIGNACTNTISGTNISCTGEEIIAIGNAATGTLQFLGGGTTPGLVMGNIAYGGGTTATGSHGTTGNA
jgi:hypothetical protein